MGHLLTTLIQYVGKPFQWWVVIAIWEQGLRVRLGKTSTLLYPGVHLRIPFLDRVYVQSIRRRTLTRINQTVTTLDKRTITFTLAIDFSIVDMEKLFNTLSCPDNTIMTRACGLVANFVATQNRADLTPSKMCQIVTDGMHIEEWGLEKRGSTITSFAEARTYRLLNQDFSNLTGLSDLENDLRNGLR